jgi:predicted  nucleic acid-binding Zn-ribbon protein
LAVVAIQNGSCGGCSKRLPPQKILEIRSMKQIHLCEVCGRILIWNSDVSKEKV